MKTQKSYKSPPPKSGYGLDAKFVDRNLVPVNPLKTQFEPTEAMPVSQHKRMAGAC